MTVTRRLYMILAFICLIITCKDSASAKYDIRVKAGTDAVYGSGDFAPFYMASNRFGTLTQSKDILFNAGIHDTLDLSRRIDFSWGIELWGGATSSVTYGKYSKEAGRTVYDNPQHPAHIWIQQLYAEFKYRCLVLSIGAKDRGSVMLDQNLSSGDVVWSGNSRAIPEVRISLDRFRDIPLTNGWVQADIALSYGKFFDKNWVINHYSYKQSRICPDPLWTYKRLYLRTRPTNPFVFQFGFQMSGMFGGTTTTYYDDMVISKIHNDGNFADFFLMLLPIDYKNHEDYKLGDHKGSWDGCASYRFKNGSSLRGYFEWFWEDGSGLVKCNGWDGLWGIEFKTGKKWWVSGAVAEYIDFTHQSGPINIDKEDFPDSTIGHVSRGRDNYYNNWYYRAYTNYGMTIGTPMVMGSIYNINGLQDIMSSRVRGIHLALEGYIGKDIMWRVRYNHRKAWGTTNTWELVYPKKADSWSVEAIWNVPGTKGLNIKCCLASDRGNMPSNGTAFQIALSYDKLLTLGK